MAGTYDYFLTDSLDDARTRLAEILRQNGFAAEATPNGGLVASRGSATRTLLLGGLAGKGMHMRFDVQFFDDNGRVVARLSRDLAAGALKGGLIGATRTASVFDELAARVGAALTAAGVLSETKTV
ncbi:MAG: hypothetical protein JWN80_2605 [Microbacteriaceae bacterium]|jgi:hypothetical protein|nr:hypothetical protein [Microbacteriaceae bacterium]